LPGLTGTLAAARALRVSLQLLEVRAADDYEAAFAAATREHAEALVVFTCYLNVQNAARIAALAATHRLPTMYSEKGGVEAGGVRSSGRRRPQIPRLAAGW